ncbi:MAG: RsmE family RNA methyltransferase [Proteobacteria bacterium]|nr:RsmE family RNA methyltransferase [Pseudomonadota bacterium]
MAHLYRFLAEHQEAGQWLLGAEEWHHILKVLRLAPDSEFELADGKGWVARAKLNSIGKRDASFDILNEAFEAERPASAQLILAIAALKPQSMDELLPFLIELGVDRIEIFSYQGMDRSRLQGKLQERWNRIAVAAIKQSKQSWLPEIAYSESFEALLLKAKAWPNRIFLDPNGEQVISKWRASLPGPTLALIGSEKGLDSAEIAALRTEGFQACRLEGGILRATTAAVAAAAVLRHGTPANFVG